MIRVTGDTHGDPLRFIENNMGDNEWNENDYLIVCGDFGYIFCDNDTEKRFLDFLETKPYTLCFCDGNHENFSAVFSYPKEKWHGGYVHRIRKNIVHLMRGQVFELDGKSFFVFGGAYSIDRGFRTVGVSWWPQELPSAEEYETGIRNLAKANYNVDYIITHTAPQEIIKKLIAKLPWDERSNLEINHGDCELKGYLGAVLNKTKFAHWFFGHWHFDIQVDDNVTAVFYNIYELL